MMPRNRSDTYAALLENLQRCCFNKRRSVFRQCRNVMPMQGDRRSEIVQVGEGTPGSEQQAQKFTRAGKVGICTPSRGARRPPHVEYNGSGTRNGARLEQSGDFTGMIDVPVSEQHDIGVRQRGFSLAEAREGSGTRVDENACNAVNEDQITRCCASRGPGSAGSEHQNF